MLPFMCVIILSIGLLYAVEKENEQDGFESQCIPFKVLIVWHTDEKDDDSFYQQRRLIVTLINGFPVQTNVSVITVGTKANVEAHFIKDKTELNSSWTDPLMQDAVNRSEILNISSFKIGDVLFKYFDVKSEMAQEVFLIVNHNAIIDDEDKARETLELKKTSIVFYGNISDQRVNMWMNLATDKRHFHILDGNIRHVNYLAGSMLVTTCQDSKLFCDNDQYWSGQRCQRCTHICSKTVKRPPETCRRACPYFNHTPLDYKFGAEIQDNDVNSQGKDNAIQVSLGNLFVLYFIAMSIMICLFCNCVQKKYKKS